MIENWNTKARLTMPVARYRKASVRLVVKLAKQLKMWATRSSVKFSPQQTIKACCDASCNKPLSLSYEPLIPFERFARPTRLAVLRVDQPRRQLELRLQSRCRPRVVQRRRL